MNIYYCGDFKTTLRWEQFGYVQKGQSSNMPIATACPKPSEHPRFTFLFSPTGTWEMHLMPPGTTSSSCWKFPAIIPVYDSNLIILQYFFAWQACAARRAKGQPLHNININACIWNLRKYRKLHRGKHFAAQVLFTEDIHSVLSLPHKHALIPKSCFLFLRANSL